MILSYIHFWDHILDLKYLNFKYVTGEQPFLLLDLFP